VNVRQVDRADSQGYNSQLSLTPRAGLWSGGAVVWITLKTAPLAFNGNAHNTPDRCFQRGKPAAKHGCWAVHISELHSPVPNYFALNNMGWLISDQWFTASEPEATHHYDLRM
jgi:hypothetical protein